MLLLMRWSSLNNIDFATGNDSDLKRIQELRRNILIASSNAGEGHIPSAFSILEILYALYVILPRSVSDNQNLDFEFILSKGHGCLALYAVLEEAKLIDQDWVSEFCKPMSNFGGHPDKVKIPSISSSTGSLGHGLPLAVGKAIANRLLGRNQRIYCLVGDGELNEGSIWESLLLSENFNLKELCLIVDFNESTSRSIEIPNLSTKLKGFSFEVVEVDGHDLSELQKALTSHAQNGPIAIIAKTTKGKGLSVMENTFAWHHRSPEASELNAFLEGIK